MNLSPTEERLRSALHAEADLVETDADSGLADIRRRSARIRTRRRALVAGAGLALVALAAVALPRLADDRADIETLPADEGTTSSVPPPPAPSVSMPGTTALPAPVGPPDAVWPPAAGDTFDNPEAAARSFVQDYVGIDDPPLGPFRSTGANSGEIDVYTRGEDGSPQADIVRSTLGLQQAGGAWGVMSAQSEAIVVDDPGPLGAVGDPVIVNGAARGFEALIIVSVRGAGMGDGEELARGTTLAGCCEELEPFHIELPVDAPGGSSGSLLLENDDPSGFGVPDFTVVPVHFVAGTGSQASDERVVSVYWVDAGGHEQAAERTVRLSEGVLRGAIQQLLFGPTSAERDAGLSSGLENAAASATFDVTITDGHAVIDFGDDLPSLSPSTSSAAASEAFLRQLHATVFQFDTVTSAEYRIRDSCDFWDWLQRPCTTVTRDDPGV